MAANKQRTVDNICAHVSSISRSNSGSSSSRSSSNRECLFLARVVERSSLWQASISITPAISHVRHAQKQCLFGLATSMSNDCCNPVCAITCSLSHNARVHHCCNANPNYQPRRMECPSTSCRGVETSYGTTHNPNQKIHKEALAIVARHRERQLAWNALTLRTEVAAVMCPKRFDAPRAASRSHC